MLYNVLLTYILCKNAQIIEFRKVFLSVSFSLIVIEQSPIPPLEVRGVDWVAQKKIKWKFRHQV